MRQINVFEKGDKVCIQYEVDSLIFKNGTIYYKLKEIKEDGAMSFLPHAYTADELIAMPTVENNNKVKVEITDDGN